MSAAHKIVESGLHPKPQESLETRVLRHTEDICRSFHAVVQASVNRIREAEQAAVSRLEAYVPTDRLLTRAEAATYLHLRIRQLDVMTRPGSTQIPFNKIGGQKRFRKAALDQWLDDNEVRKLRVKL